MFDTPYTKSDFDGFIKTLHREPLLSNYRKHISMYRELNSMLEYELNEQS